MTAITLEKRIEECAFKHIDYLFNDLRLKIHSRFIHPFTACFTF